MFLAKSIRPNYVNYNYFQKQMKMSKDWSSRPSTSNVLLGASSLNESGNFVMGRTSALLKKPATDFIVKNKESVATQNQPQSTFKLPTTSVLPINRNSNRLPTKLPDN